MPTGLEYFGGRLYASSWSIASFLGIPHAGQLVQVKPARSTRSGGTTARGDTVRPCHPGFHRPPKRSKVPVKTAPTARP